MSDPKSAGNDPSMDDILASIRKIISDDEARAQVPGGVPASAPSRAVPPVRPTVVPSIAPVTAPAIEPRPTDSRPIESRPVESRQPTGDDILLLTDLIEEPQATGSASSAIPLPRIDPVRASEMPQPSFESPPPMPIAAEAPAGKRAEASLVGGSAASSTASAFARLNQAVEDSVLQPAARDAGPVVGGSGKTVEDMVREMLRPMLQEWLDRNLPQMVERLVEKEIVRLTRR